jgi:carbon storage regulator
LLILAREIGQKFTIGDGVEITVISVNRGKVRLGIEADRSIPVWRSELLPIDPAKARKEPAK